MHGNPESVSSTSGATLSLRESQRMQYPRFFMRLFATVKVHCQPLMFDSQWTCIFVIFILFWEEPWNAEERLEEAGASKVNVVYIIHPMDF